MAGGEDQNPASSSPGLTGEVVGSDEGLTTISFWGLDGGEMGSPGAGGVARSVRPRLPSVRGAAASWRRGSGAVVTRRARGSCGGGKESRAASRFRLGCGCGSERRGGQWNGATPCVLGTHGALALRRDRARGARAADLGTATGPPARGSAR